MPRRRTKKEPTPEGEMVSVRRRILAESQRDDVVRRYLHGETLQEIARSYGKHHTWVFREIEKARTEWRHSLNGRLDDYLAEQLARVSRIEVEAWDAWERSKLPRARTRTVRRGKDKENQTVTHDIVREDQVGDERFLARVAWCVEKRLELAGLKREPWRGFVPEAPPPQAMVDAEASPSAVDPQTQDEVRRLGFRIAAAIAQRARVDGLGLIGSPVVAGHVCNRGEPGRVDDGTPPRGDGPGADGGGGGADQAADR